MVADRAWVRMGGTLFPGSGRMMGSLGRDNSSERLGGRTGGRRDDAGSRKREVGGEAGELVGGQAEGILTAQCAALDTEANQSSVMKSRGAASDRKTERGTNCTFGNKRGETRRIETALPFQTDRLSKHRVGCMVGRRKHRAGGDVAKASRFGNTGRGGGAVLLLPRSKIARPAT